MNVEKMSNGYYTVKVSDTEQLIIDELAAIYDMPCDDIVKMMFSFSSSMAVSRILNQINGK